MFLDDYEWARYLFWLNVDSKGNKAKAGKKALQK